MATRFNFRPLVTAGTLLGLGLGGFFDGIFFHQILQIHNMFSSVYFPNTVPNLEINMFWDGLFHASTWILTLAGVLFLWRAVRHADVPRSGKGLAGSMFFGWGLFNLVEGVIDHHILRIHHVFQRMAQPAQLYWDLAFLASGLILMMIGRGMIRRAQDEAKSHPRHVQTIRGAA